MEVLGAVAATSQILTQAISIAKMAREVYHSFQDAPEEIEQVGRSCDRIRFQVEQLRDLGQDLSAADMEYLFPEPHRLEVYAALQQAVAPLTKLRSLKASEDPTSIRSRLCWATMDKDRVKRVMREVSDAQATLNTSLNILSIRQNTLHHQGLGALKAAQDAFVVKQTNLECSMAQVQHTQHFGFGRMNDVSTATHDLVQESIAQQRNLLANQQAVMDMMKSVIDQKIQSPQDTSNIQSYLAIQPIAARTCQPDRCLDRESMAHLNDSSSTHCDDSPQYQPLQYRGGSMWDATEQPARKCLSSDLSLASRISPSSYRSLSYAAATVQLHRKVRGKRKDTQLRVYLKILGRCIIYSELCIQTYIGAWFSVPSISSNLRTINIRPVDAPIFQAIEKMDLIKVKRLLENGDASIHDVSEGEGYTLLGTLVQSTTHAFSMDLSGAEDQIRPAEMMLAYLRREGCDPNTLCQASSINLQVGAVICSDASKLTLTSYRSPMAFSIFNDSIRMPELLFRYGADPEWSPLIDHLSRGRTSTLEAQIRLLESWEVFNWRHAQAMHSKENLIRAYCTREDVRPLVRAIEEDGLDVNYAAMSSTPLELALSRNCIEVAAVLTAYGASSNFNLPDGSGQPRESPLAHVLRGRGFVNSHFLLFHHADPGKSWHNLFGWSLRNEDVCTGRFCFDHVVGLALHMLYHGASCHFSHADTAYLEPQTGLTRLPDIYNLGYRQANPELNEMEQKSTLWTDRGVVCLDGYDLIHEILQDWRRSKPGLRSSPDLPRCFEPDIGDENQSDIESEYDREIPHAVFWDAEINGPRKYQHAQTPDYWMNKPNFEFNERIGFRNISRSRHDRQKLSRWPLVVAYCTAVQLAGYRAEMDDEGDVWWSDDDGDRYMDARVEQLGSHADEEVASDCPMCQDPAAWGLGEFREREDDALRIMRSYKHWKGERQTVEWLNGLDKEEE